MAKVLILDDDEVLSQFLAIGLRRAGHDVRTAANRDQAYSIASDFRPEVLVVEWKPTNDVEGLEVTQVRRSGLPKVQAILITAYPSQALERRAEVVEVWPVVAKPIDLTMLTGAVEEAALRESKRP